MRLLPLVLALSLVGCGPAPSSLAPAAETAAKARSVAYTAGTLAERSLRKNLKQVRVADDPLSRTVIVAGSGHFGSLWARDAAYASFGLIAMGELAPVRDTLKSLLNYQREDGLIPRRLGGGSNAVGILRNAVGLHPGDNSHLKAVDFAKPSVDANSLVTWLAADYFRVSGDRAFLDKYLPRLHRAMAWLAARERDGLLYQQPFGDWKDMFARGGRVMYSNALYYRALQAMEQLSRAADDEVKAKGYALRAEDVRNRIQDVFWDPERGHFRDTDTLRHFSPEGDFLAVLFGLADPEQRERIFDYADTLLERETLLPAADEPYPDALVPVYMKLAGLRGYHDAFAWPWLMDLYAWAAAEAGDRARAQRILERVGRLALKDGTFHEIYENDPPVPVKRRFYASEPDFSWHAGLYRRALAALEGR